MSRTRQSSRVARIFVTIVATTAVLLAMNTLASIPQSIALSGGNPYSSCIQSSVVSERFVYEFRWGGLPAATAEWRTHRRTAHGKDMLEGTGKAKTLKPVAVFWKMRGTIRAILGVDPIVPDHFTLYRTLHVCHLFWSLVNE